MLTRTLEKLLNRGLPRSPRARELCLQLAGKTLAIEVRDITRLRLSSTGSTLVLSVSDAPAEASLSGGPLALLGLLGGSPQQLLQRGAVSLGGDTHLAQSFRELLTLLRPDPEEELSLLVGDVPAHQLGRLARVAASPSEPQGRCDRRRRTPPSTSAMSARISCRAREGEQFLRGVDAVREDVDRLRGAPRAASPQRANARRAVKLRVAMRLLEIQRVLLQHGLDDYVRATHLYRPLRFMFYLSPGIWFERRRASQPRRAAAARARGARADLREVRPGGLDPARPAARRHRR